MARELAESSIVTKCLARYIRQILEFVVEDRITPLEQENERLKAEIARLKGDDGTSTV